MFLEKTIRRNPALVQTSFDLHQKGLILPDTYVIDLDALLANAKHIIESAQKYDLKMYFMLKQLGRNPIIAKEAYEDPDKVKSAPHTTVVGRLDEASAARNLNIRWRKPE